MTPIGRFVSAAPVALGVTTLLFFWMAALVENSSTMEVEDSRLVADIHMMEERDIETRIKPVRPDKPEPSPRPAVALSSPVEHAANVSLADIKITALDLDLNMAFNVDGLVADDGEYLPQLRVEPQYPSRAVAMGIEGYVIVEFTVTKRGKVKDPRVLEAHPPAVFNRAALKAVAKWQYKARRVKGEPVDVHGVQTRLQFKIAK